MSCERPAHAKSGGRKRGDNKSVSAAVKLALGILITGFVAGIALVIVINRVMKKIFVNEDWPSEEWSSDDWAGEDLEG